MRNALIIAGVALALASAGPLTAQETAAVPRAATADSAKSTPFLGTNLGTRGTMEMGYRGASVDGDEARWERFRDLREGPRAAGSLSSETEASAFHFSANNVGYRDQRYTADYNRFGKMKLSAQWNSIPLNYAYYSMTPWKNQGDNVWTLDAAARTQVQSKTPGVLGIGTTAAQYDQASIYRGLAAPFPMQSRRDIMSLGMKYRLTDAVGLNMGFSSTKKSGTQPYGGSFAFSNANERPMSLDNRTNDANAAVEWARPSLGMVRAEWVGSWFDNKFLSLTWDNPLRATDFSNGKAPPAGPYDPSGYSNGNGPAIGRLALPPSNNMNTFSVVALHKMPGHTSLNGQIAYTTMKQNEKLIPWTTNSVIASPVVFSLFPTLASLPRPTAEAEVHAMNAQINFTTRPSQYFAFDMRYRFNDHENRTPFFDAREWVRFDAVPEEAEESVTEHFNIRQNTLETGATLTMIPNSSFKLGYIVDDVKRDGRGFSGMTDYTFRASVDTYGNQYVMLRALYERTNRVGNGFSESAIEDAAAQPGLRFYDEADMGRDKGSVVLQVTPSEKFDLGFVVAAGKDKYRGAGHEFGLLDNSNSSYNFSFNVYPVDRLTLGANYGYEKFGAFQKSRNSNPFSGVAGVYESWLDPNRDWNLDNDEKVQNFGLYADFTQALPNTDLRLNYDRSHSNQAFVYGGPRIKELSTNVALTPGDGSPCGAGIASCFTPLPDITNTWQQLRVEATHTFRSVYAVGAGYSYEKFNVVDFATRNLPDGTPRVDPLGAITTGYGNRPYKGQTFVVRFMYMLRPRTTP